MALEMFQDFLLLW